MTTLLKGGTIYDGTGSVPREADIFVHGATIARIGSRLNIKARNVVEARGALITPGFVDIANYADHYGALFSDPAGTEPLIRGITSLVVGHGGASQAPLSTHGILPEWWWGDAAIGAVRATTIKEFLTLLEGRIGVNVGTLVGHSTIREGITRGVPRDLTERETELLENIVTQSLRSGALGVSVNLEYIRTAHVPRAEFIGVGRAAKKAGGLFALRLRNRGEELKESFSEVLAISEATDANLLVTDLEPHVREEANYRALATHITRASAHHHLHFTTSGTGMAAFPLPLFLPPHWRENEWDKMYRHLNKPSMHGELCAYLAHYRNLPIWIASVADPSLKLFEGTSFAKWSLHEHLPFEEALIKLMEVTRFRAVLVVGIAEPQLVKTFAIHDRALIASGEAAAPALETSAHLKLLAQKDDAVFPLEQRIARMTGAPAKKLGLHHRGTLKEGNYADILVIEKGIVREALVNGERAIREGAPTGGRGGMVLARQ